MRARREGPRLELETVSEINDDAHKRRLPVSPFFALEAIELNVTCFSLRPRFDAEVPDSSFHT